MMEQSGSIAAISKGMVRFAPQLLTFRSAFGVPQICRRKAQRTWLVIAKVLEVYDCQICNVGQRQ